MPIFFVERKNFEEKYLFSAVIKTKQEQIHQLKCTVLAFLTKKGEKLFTNFSI